jgi:hypothetical protein
MVKITKPVALAVRDPLPGVGLDAIEHPGAVIAFWLHSPDAQQIRQITLHSDG